MGRIFTDEHFAKRARKADITDDVLRKTVRNADAGTISAQLGAGIVKLRVARPGRGKSGGYRTILAYERNSKAFFIHFFPKNSVDNIDGGELADLKAYGKILLAMTEEELTMALKRGALVEII